MMGSERTATKEKKEESTVKSHHVPSSDNAGKISLAGSSQNDAQTCSVHERCEDAVRERAFLLWEQAGCPEGDGVNFWIEAEQELHK
jgi:hypothetical protein